MIVSAHWAETRASNVRERERITRNTVIRRETNGIELFSHDSTAFELNERADKARRRAAARDSNGSSPGNPGRH